MTDHVYDIRERWTDITERRLKDGLVKYDCPYHMHEGVLRYLMRGIPGGDFMRLLFSNDFMGAVGRADSENQPAVLNWVRFLYNSAPVDSYGSPEQYRDWCKAGGIVGMRNAEAQAEVEEDNN